MKRKWIYLLTALTLAVGVCGAKPMISGAAALDLEEDCFMTIFPESKDKTAEQKFGDDLEINAQVVIDVYKVADAIRVPGYDAYSYEFKGAYKELSLPQNKDSEGIKHPTAEDWRSLSQEAAEIALTGNGDTRLVISTVDASKDRRPMWLPSDPDTGETAAGLYLLIARSRDMSEIADYKIHMGSETGDIATIASSEQYTYIFSPELISIPMRGQGETLDVKGPSPEAENGPLPGGMSGDYTYTTSDDGEWIYNLNVYLKPVRVPRYGSLEIEKKLNVYESEEEVATPSTPPTIGQEEQTTFIFEASWEEKDENGNSKTNTRVDSVTFPIIKADGTKAYDWYLYMDRIPVGTDIKVTEVYSGASYDNADKDGITRMIQVKAEKIKDGIALLNKDNTIKTIINSSQLAPEVDGNGKRTVPVEASVAFTNTYNWDQKKGYGIKNQFTYDENGKWLWTSDPQQEAGDPGMPIFNGEISHLDVEQTPQ